VLLGARAHLAWCDLVDGNLDAAIAHAQAVIDDAGARGWASQLQVRCAYLSLALARSLRGEFEAADRIVASGLAADANGVEAWPTVALHLAQASVAVSRRRPRAATAALDSARIALRERPVSPSLADALTRTAAEVAMLTGSADHSPMTDDPAVSATDWSIRARTALARGDLDGAMRAAGQVPRRPESGSLDDVVAAIEAAVCEALVAGQQRRMALAIEAMGDALAMAAPQRIVRPFAVAGSGDLVRILRAAPAAGATAALRQAVIDRLGSDDEPAPARPEPEPLLEPLTERELAVLAELPTMRTNEEIARDLYVSINTVKSHLAHLYRKLGVGNRREAVRRARDLGLLL
jgi:LuxR family maltose regulon positive regulatory protein